MNRVPKLRLVREEGRERGLLNEGPRLREVREEERARGA